MEANPPLQNSNGSLNMERGMALKAAFSGGILLRLVGVNAESGRKDAEFFDHEFRDGRGAYGLGGAELAGKKK